MSRVPCECGSGRTAEWRGDPNGVRVYLCDLCWACEKFNRTRAARLANLEAPAEKNDKGGVDSLDR